MKKKLDGLVLSLVFLFVALRFNGVGEAVLDFFGCARILVLQLLHYGAIDGASTQSLDVFVLLLLGRFIDV